MKQAIIYTRFSPRPNANESMSCEFQEQKAREYCAYRDMDILAVYQDRGASGKQAKNRPGLEAALVHVCKERGVLVCYNLARLSRSMKDLVRFSEIFKKNEIDLCLVTEHVDTKTPTGMAFFWFMGIMAQWIRETTAEHTRTVLKNMQANGLKVTSRPPYGFMIDPNDISRIVPNPAERGTLELIMRYHKQGLSHYRIAQILGEKGYLPRGKRWHHTSIKRIIARNNDK